MRMNKYEITFEQDKKKYHKARRTVTVQANNSLDATNLVHSRWGSFKEGTMDKNPSDRIIIVDIKEAV